MTRPSKDEYYLTIAEAVSLRSTCLRRQYGAVLVKNDRIISTGYNGSARETLNCCDTGECFRERMNIPHGEHYELCRSVHAEMNAIINANVSDYGDWQRDTVLYLAGFENGKTILDPEICLMCKRVLRNAQIQEVVVRSTYDGGPYRRYYPTNTFFGAFLGKEEIRKAEQKVD